MSSGSMARVVMRFSNAQTMQLRNMPRISSYGLLRSRWLSISTQSPKIQRFSTSTAVQNAQSQHPPPPPQQNTAPPSKLEQATDRTQTAKPSTGSDSSAGAKRDKASSVLFWIGGVGVIYAGWRLERRFWRGEAVPRVGV
ncbi:hypothetical protein VTL71DRAFT_12429 [Oculimacula yallundae]|uniref:Uncharacterized protein n=1 Tax=Oculimacula yallundae TaxID=86028 RepID=A0ABR4CQ71_9HELO